MKIQEVMKLQRKVLGITQQDLSHPASFVNSFANLRSTGTRMPMKLSIGTHIQAASSGRPISRWALFCCFIILSREKCLSANRF